MPTKRRVVAEAAGAAARGTSPQASRPRARSKRPEAATAARRAADRHRPAACAPKKDCAVRRAIGLLRPRCRCAPARGRFAASRRMCFSRSPRSFSARRDARRELDHAVVEEREAALDRVRHRHAVALRREDVARQQVGGLEILRLRQRMPAREIRRQRWRAARRARRSRRASRCRSAEKKSFAPARRAEARQMREQRIVDRVEVGREERLRDSGGLRLQLRQIRIELAEAAAAGGATAAGARRSGGASPP